MDNQQVLRNKQRLDTHRSIVIPPVVVLMVRQKLMCFFFRDLTNLSLVLIAVIQLPGPLKGNR